MKTLPRGVAEAVTAAVLFGASTPFSKMLLGDFPPFLLAGLLYAGSGAGLLAVIAVKNFLPGGGAKEAGLTRRDMPWLAGATFFGGFLGPVLLVYGLSKTPASSASLLLNLEGVLTALLAWFVFRENFDRRIAFGMALITAGGVLLSWAGSPELSALVAGPLAIAGACLSWAVDNNLTKKISGGDPFHIACIKGLFAGCTNLAISFFVLGLSAPGASKVAGACVTGFFGYGISLVLFVLALRHIGTARTGAYFSLAPFFGSAISIALLGEAVTGPLLLAASLMGAGIYCHLTEKHEHEHGHEYLEHEHSHDHDDGHHVHGHAPGDEITAGGAHSHRHVHAAMTHCHFHFPDTHHEHTHAG